MKVHPLIAIIIGLLLVALITIGLTVLNLGIFSVLIGLFSGAVIATDFSRNNKIAGGLSIGIIYSLVIVVASSFQGIILTNSYQLILIPLITVFAGVIMNQLGNWNKKVVEN